MNLSVHKVEYIGSSKIEALSEKPYACFLFGYTLIHPHTHEELLIETWDHLGIVYIVYNSIQMIYPINHLLEVVHIRRASL